MRAGAVLGILPVAHDLAGGGSDAAYRGAAGAVGIVVGGLIPLDISQERSDGIRGAKARAGDPFTQGAGVGRAQLLGDRSDLTERVDGGGVGAEEAHHILHLGALAGGCHLTGEEDPLIRVGEDREGDVPGGDDHEAPRPNIEDIVGGESGLSVCRLVGRSTQPARRLSEGELQLILSSGAESGDGVGATLDEVECDRPRLSL